MASAKVSTAQKIGTKLICQECLEIGLRSDSYTKDRIWSVVLARHSAQCFVCGYPSICGRLSEQWLKTNTMWEVV